jgi:hypothetical protein
MLTASQKLTKASRVTGILIRQVRLFGALALLLLMGGQMLSGCLEYTCSKDQAVQEHASCPDRQDCPVDDCCFHPCIHLAKVERQAFLFHVGPSTAFVIQNESCEEGRSREIDHPPQLS